MFWTDWTLRCGEGEMGCFVKDTLYRKRTKSRIDITGTVNNNFGEGVGGVSITFSGGEGTAATDTDGNYIFSVNPGWSGTATPEKNHYTFQPPDRTYFNVTSSRLNQDFICSRIIYAPVNCTGQRMLNRSLSQVECINVLSWEDHSDNEDMALYRVYLIEGADRSLLADLSPNKHEYRHRRVSKDRQYVYSIVAVNHRGNEGTPANITIH
jgi:hypothetical protein